MTRAALRQISDDLQEHHGDIRVLDAFSILEGDDQASNTRWHQIGLEGKWSGHWMGAFHLDARMFAEMLEHFNAKSVDTVVDYEHESVFGSGSDAIAAGWVTELQARDSDAGKTLFARVEWNTRAAKHISEREFRYISPTFAFHTRDRKSGKLTGASLHSIALTNTPFLDELPEVRLNSIRAALSGVDTPPQEQEMDDKKKAALCALLGLSADATPEQMIETARSQSVDVQGIESIGLALGLEPGSDSVAILSSVRALKAVGIKVDQLEAEMLPLREQAERVSKIESDRRIEQARNDGKIVATNEEWATALATGDPAGFDAWALAAPKVVPVDVKTPATGGSPAVNGSFSDEQIKAMAGKLSADELASCKSSGIAPESFVRANLDDALLMEALR